jgi:hypothetical protein
MYLPKMNEPRLSSTTISQFGGYDHRATCSVNCGYDMENMSSNHAPHLAPRSPRGKLNFNKGQISGVTVNEQIYCVIENAVYDESENKIILDPKDGSFALVENGSLKGNYTIRKLVNMGAQIVIFPDKIMFNTREIDSTTHTVPCYGLENIRSSITGTSVNGGRLCLTKEGSSIQNPWAGSQSIRLFQAVNEKIPDADNYDDASFLFNKMVDGSDRPSDWVWNDEVGNNWKTGTETDSGDKFYYTNSASNMLDLSGALYCNPELSPPKLYEFVKYQIDEDIHMRFKWVEVKNPLIKLTCSYCNAFGNSLRKSDYYNVYDPDNGSISNTRATNGIGKYFNVGDVIELTKEVYRYKSGEKEMSQTQSNCGNVFSEKHTVYEVGEDYIVFDGELDMLAFWYSLSTSSSSYFNDINVKRAVPNMDFVCENNNRLFGCSSENHEIYASKLGDPKNWYSYAGISTDGYAATVGTDGDFTGCIAHLGSVLFFKEDCIHRLYGTQPSNFQLSVTECNGLQKGSDGSLCVLDEILYYLSPRGPVAFDGNLPASLYDPLGDVKYTSGVGGKLRGKYYLSVLRSDNTADLLVYDTGNGMWHVEDHTRFTAFVPYHDDLLGVCGTALWSLGGGYGTKEASVGWKFVSGEFGSDSFEFEHIAKLLIRLTAEKGTKIKASMQYDGGEWNHAFSCTATESRAFTIPIIPRRCDTMRIRLEGQGGAKLLALSIYTEKGSEIRG